MPFPPIKTISPAAGWGKDWRLPPQRVLPLRRTPRAAYHWTADSIRRRPPAMLSRSKISSENGQIVIAYTPRVAPAGSNILALVPSVPDDPAAPTARIALQPGTL